MNLKNQKNWAFFDPSRPKTTENGSGYQWSATGPILSFCIFSGPKFTILSWRSTSTLTKTVFGTFSDSFSLALNKVAQYHPKRTKNGLLHIYCPYFSPLDSAKLNHISEFRFYKKICCLFLFCQNVLIVHRNAHCFGQPQDTLDLEFSRNS